MQKSVSESKKLFLILVEASQDGFLLICADFSLRSLGERRNLFYIVDAL